STATTRAVAVVALLAVAALALQGRRGLDWSELDDPVDVSWLRATVSLLLLVVLWQLARPLVRRLRRPARRNRPGEGDDGPDGERVPFWLRLASLALVLASLLVAWWLLSAIVPTVRQPEVTQDGPGAGAEDDGGTGLGPSWTSLLLAAGVLLAVLAVNRWSTARRARAALAASPGHADGEAARLETAVVAAQEQLGGHTDPRAAIVAAYAAMAATLSAGLARRGASARASDTPTELLTRAVGSGLVSEGPSTTLTELFREARFSRHPMGEGHRRAAEDALHAVRTELAGVRRA
ncbi:MAG TPA: DUF4129 domain-containing protein, partial [Actinomycetes bacterium]|nr:DUF4129 domain-containing protein [Actinomycetes bacterium]